VKRYVKGKKGRVTLESTNAQKEYSKYFNAVDRNDQDSSNYSVSLRTARWYLHLLFWLADRVMHRTYTVVKSLQEEHPLWKICGKDPMCFCLKGKCEHDDNFTLLQQGMTPFVGDLRQTCTTIAVERGSQSYSQYKILFGCRRGGYNNSCESNSRFHKFRRQLERRNNDAFCTGDYPVILSEIRLLGKCNEGSPTPPPTSPLSRPPTNLPTNVPTVRTKFNMKIKVRCIHNPCDKNGPRDEFDVYVKVYSNGLYIGKTRTVSDVKDNRTYCYNQSFYPPNITIRVGATSWQVRFEVYDYDRRSGDDFIGQYSYTMSSAPKTYSSSSGKSLSSGCGSRTKISFEIKAY